MHNLKTSEAAVPVGHNIEAHNARWSFSGATAANFDDHVRRSVPFYDAGHELVAQASDFFLGEGSLAYELGCSTGQLTERLAERNAGKGARIVALDVEPEMAALARARCARFPEVEVVEGDLLAFELALADLIVSYYTLQFVRPQLRQLVFDKIYRALNWGGGFLLFEKVRAPDARFQDMMTSMYTDYKLAQGFTPVEVINKARSLKGVLEPFSTAGNLDLMRRAGFVDMMTIFKCVTFEGFLAIK